jgi:hypothetical protein
LIAQTLTERSRQRNVARSPRFSAPQRRGRSRAQQPGTPVIGLLESRSPDAISDRLRISPGPQRHGPCRENIAIEYRFAENQIDRLSTLAADLVRR